MQAEQPGKNTRHNWKLIMVLVLALAGIGLPASIAVAEVYADSGNHNGKTAGSGTDEKEITPVKASQATLTATPQAAEAGGCYGWSMDYAPTSYYDAGILQSITVANANDAWAVGYGLRERGQFQWVTSTRVEHWDGTSWGQASSPNIEPIHPFFGPFINNYLNSVSAASANDAWAVGSYFDGGLEEQTLIEHWNGSEWSIVPESRHGAFDGVSARASDDVWAVGAYYTNTIGYQTLIQHWDGSQWSVVPSPSVGQLTGVSSVATNDAWAVGFKDDHTLIEHWDGQQWSVMPSYVAGRLNSISALATDDMWAVGSNEGMALTQHWDGQEWRVVPSPNPGGNYPSLNSSLNSVSAYAHDNVWAVGSTDNQNLTQHWDGQEWSIVRGLSLVTNRELPLMGVAVIPNAGVFAVGYFSVLPSSPHTPGLFGTIERYAGTTTSCAVQFSDVPPNSTYYPYLRCLACRGIVSGYQDGTFKPNLPITRGQIAKMVGSVVLFGSYIGLQAVQDVPSSSPFYAWINSLTKQGIMSGYPCGGPGEPCELVYGYDLKLPYFRSSNNASRGQVAKIVSNAAHFNDDPGVQLFEDVPADSPFYDYVQRLANRHIAQGYQCGGEGEPCVQPGNRPYFRPAGNATRGQAAKLVNSALFTGQITPAR